MVFLWVAVSDISSCTNFFLLLLVSSNFDWLNYEILGNFFSVTLRMESIYIHIYMGGSFWKKQRRKKRRDNGGEETNEKCEELEGKSQALLKGKEAVGCYKSGVGVCVQQLMP